MANLNKVMLIGNLAADPDVRTTPSGRPVTELRLAINRFVPGAAEGERREETTFLDITCWGRTAEVAGQYLAKGRSVYIEGRLQQDSWEDKQTGQKRYKLRIIADNMQMLGSRGDGPQGGGNYQQQGGNNYQQRSGGYGNSGYQQRSGGYQQPRQQAPAPAPAPAPMEEEDDIPF